MADEQTGHATEVPGKAPSPSPLPERARAEAQEAAKAVYGVISGGQVATPADHEASPHTPDASGGGDASDTKARGKSLSETPPPSTFKEWLHNLRQSMPDMGTLERVREAMEPECP
jgi:hypothetical protein